MTPGQWVALGIVVALAVVSTLAAARSHRELRAIQRELLRWDGVDPGEFDRRVDAIRRGQTP